MIFKYDEEELLYYFTADQLKRFGAGSIKKLVDELSAESENIGDFCSRLDTLTSGTENGERLKMLGIGAGISNVTGSIIRESRFISAIRKKLEEDNDLVSALEVEKKYCYSKNEYYPTCAIFPHYIHLLRIALLLDRDTEVNYCLARMFCLISSSGDRIPDDVMSALNDLSKVCNYDKLESRETMQDVLCNCEWLFPQRKQTYDEDLDEWVDNPDPPKDALYEMIRYWCDSEFTISKGAVVIQNGKVLFDRKFVDDL